MIVNHTPQGWEVFFQYAHGLLAGQLVHQLRPELRSRYWTDTLSATISHDDYRLDFSEKNYLTDQGTPLDFSMESPTDRERLDYIRRVCRSSAQKSGWIGALVARHMEFLHQSFAEEDEELAALLRELRDRRKRYRRRFDSNLDEERAAYLILRFGDRLSLLLCRREVPDGQRRVEINRAMGEETYFLSRHPKAADTLTVDPWPFGPDKFTVHAERRLLAPATFKNNAELEEQLDAVNADLVSWRFRAS